MERTRLGAMAVACLCALNACKSDRKEAASSAPAGALTAVEAQDTKTSETRPTDVVYAGSAHLRVVDIARGEVVAKSDFSIDIRAISFSPDGATAYLAMADGVRRFDARAHRMIDRMTSSPARSIELIDEGRQLLVLEHDVIVSEDGRRTPTPFRVITLDTATGRIAHIEEVGERILYARPSMAPKLAHLVVTEAQDVLLGAAPTKLSAGELLRTGLEGDVRIRPFVAVHGNHAYLPVEGRPSRILDVNLEQGTAEPIGLERPLTIRGLAVTPNGSSLLVNTGIELIKIGLRTGAIEESIELLQPHLGIAVSSDGEWAYLAQTIDGTGGAVGIVGLEPLRYFGKIHLDDISPWAIGVQPRPATSSAP